MLKLLLQTNQLSTGVGYILDFDHQFIPTEKYDTKYSYKNARGYFPGKATVFGIEKNNQDVYNSEQLASLIDKTIITRKFRE